MNLQLPALIGGTGVHPALTGGQREVVTTRWGEAVITRLVHERHPWLLLNRHHADPDGRPRPPHRVNYRANLDALRQLGATAVFATTAVGSLRADWAPGTLVLLDQLLDFTTGRPRTFFDDEIHHVDFTRPYDEELRTALREAAQRQGLPLHSSGTYLCADGPRFETAAEVALFRSWGADVVGMTAMPETILAREADLPYAAVSLVSNLGAGISPQPLTQQEVVDAMAKALPGLLGLILATMTAPAVS